MSVRVKKVVREARQEIARDWIGTLMPLLLSLSTGLGALAVRRSNEAREDIATTAQSVAGMMQDRSKQTEINRQKIAALESRISALEHRLGRAERRSTGPTPTALGESPASQPVVNIASIGSGIWHFFFPRRGT